MTPQRTPVPMGLLCLVVLLAAPTWGSNCNLLKRHQRRFNRESVELLKRMEGKLPAECLLKMPAFSFPKQILGIRQPRAATKAVLEILQGFMHLLHDDHPSVAWKSPLQKRFLHMLDEQIQRVQVCLGRGKPTPGKRKEEQRPKLHLKKYFRSVRNFLEEKGLDSCTQEFVRHGIQLGFPYLEKLTERMEI